MKNASEKMFRYGNLVNRIYFIISLVLAPLGILLMILGVVQDPVNQSLVDSGSKCLGWGIYFLVMTILCFILVFKAQREIPNKEPKNFGPYIVSIVFGVLSENPFYVLAGIFGIIADSKENNQKEEPKQVEEQKEEPKEE